MNHCMTHYLLDIQNMIIEIYGIDPTTFYREAIRRYSCYETFYHYKVKINYDSIIRSGWVINDYRLFIDISKKLNIDSYSHPVPDWYFKCGELALEDFENNIEKYIAEATIKNIIE